MKLSFKVSQEDHGKVVKFILKSRMGLSEKLVKKLKYSEKILLNSIPVFVNAKVSTGDILEALIELDENNENIIPEPMNLDILYEDENLIAINKPTNTVVHPSFRHFTGTIANGLQHYLRQKEIRTLIRPVSRLDKDTSGIIVFALNPFVQDHLSRQMQNNSYIKEYVGLVHGLFKESSGTINLPIKRQSDSIMLRHVAPDGAHSITHYKVLESFQDASYLQFSLETGRTHQIRVHCQSIGHPLIGDTLYFVPQLEERYQNLIKRQALHSARAVFTHPVTHQILDLKAPIPSDIQHSLEILRNNMYYFT